MNSRLLVLFACIIAGACSCSPKPTQPTSLKDTFGYDLAFLKRHDSSLVVLGNGEEKVIVSPKYQGKVFTSTATGDNGLSFGWIHYSSFDKPPVAHINVYGGESRFWLGPEGGKYSLFFPPGAKMEFANWQTPAGIDTDPWTVTGKMNNVVLMQRDLELTNYANTRLRLKVLRSVSILSRKNIEDLLHFPGKSEWKLDTALKTVGFYTANVIINRNPFAWTEETGMPCIWVLDMFPPSPSTTIVIPYHKGSEDPSGKPATTDYFGEIPKDRININDSVIYFRADGKSRGKLGVHPAYAGNMMGSYDADRKVLTIIWFDAVEGRGKYLNQEWNTAKPPFSGDAVNAYDDGPLADGGQLGPFYEMESVSPAASLAPGDTTIHQHSVFHFVGPDSSLDKVARHVLGVSLETIKKQFQ